MPLDVERYGLIYAGAQKNAGPAGVTVIIVRDDLLGEGPALACCPSYMSYRTQADNDSMMNTPNTFGIYLCGKVFRWVENEGGLAAMEKRNRQKAKTLYDLLDRSEIFVPTAQPESRSISNVTFRCATPELDEAFISGARERGIEGIKGHRLVGGMRASIYNAVSQDPFRCNRSLRQFERTVDSNPGQQPPRHPRGAAASSPPVRNAI